jgi:hypothetical protein
MGTIRLIILIISLSLAHAPLASGNFPNPTGTPQKPEEATTTAQPSPQDYQAILDRLNKLETENEKLEKASKVDYPSGIEKLGFDITVLATYSAVVVGCVAVFIALLSMNSFRSFVKKSSRRESLAINESMHNLVEGRFLFAAAYIFAQAAWDKKQEYKPTPLTHLSSEAIAYLIKSRSSFEGDSIPEFKKKMNIMKAQTLNNLVFYLTLSAACSEQSQVAVYASELRTCPGFSSNGIWINTYCRAAIKFVDLFANNLKKDARSILDDVSNLCEKQAYNGLTQRSQTELARIQVQLSTAKSQADQTMVNSSSS